jgi:adenylate cyclase
LRFRIRPTLTLAMTALVAMTALGFAIAIDWFAGRIVARLAERQFETLARSAATQSRALVASARDVLDEQLALARQGLLPLDDNLGLGRRFAERLRREPQLAWISYADGARDRFVGATRLKDGRIAVNHSERAVDAGRPIEQVALPDGGWSPAPDGRKSPYSVLHQAWYVQALGSRSVVLIGPYGFAEGRVGVTLATAASRDSVLTVDLLLSDLSRALAALADHRGDAVMLSDDGRVLASAGSVRLPDLTADALALSSGGSVRAGVPTAARTANGTFRVASSRIDAGLATSWTLVVLQPDVVLMAPLAQLHRAVGLIAVLVGGLAFATALLVARNLARPLAGLSAEAEKIRRFDLEEPIHIRSRIVELASLVRAMDAMKATLRSFGRFVPKDVVERLLAAGGTATLGGERRELSILFSDIIGFTAMSEELPPEHVMVHVSRYFDVLSKAIHQHEGVIDKFIGDAIKAIWNAPTPDPDHARHACAALLACMEANDRLDRERRADGAPALSSRFGLHRGEAIAGNVGAADRMQYTALGATVNLAARLESLNKHYGTRNLVSAAVRERAGEGFVFRSVAIVMPAGTSRPTEVFELLSDSADSAWVARWEAAMQAFRTGRRVEATEQFGKLSKEMPADRLAAYYVARVGGTSADVVEQVTEK